MTDQDIFKKAIDTWGIDMQEDMAIDEMSELTKAIIKKRRGKGSEEQIIEELADVGIMVCQLCEHYGYDKINKVYTEKINRLKELLSD